MTCVTRLNRAGFVSLALILLAPAAANAQDFLRGTFGGSTARWDGVNFGVSLGLTNMNTDFGNSSSALVAYSLRNTTVENEFSPSSWTTLPSTTTNSRQYGAFLGYNWQWDQLVIGADVAYNNTPSLQTGASDSISRLVTTSDTYVNSVTITAASSIKLVDYATMRARFGYAMGQFLPYAVLGGAVGRFNYTNTATTTVSGTSTTATPPTYGPTTDMESNSKNNAITGGVLAGLGVDVAVLPNVFLRAEWEFIAFAPVGGIKSNINTGRVGIGVKF